MVAEREDLESIYHYCVLEIEEIKEKNTKDNAI
jgi:hypothetical protein